MTETTQTETKPRKSVPDRVRLKNAATRHGLAALAFLTLFGAADAWYQVTGLFLAGALSVINGLVAGAYLAGLFHEWGHFTGARLSGSYSPLSPDVRGIFMFGFNYEKNTTNQFLALSAGGPAANLLLVALVFFALPLDSWGRGALFAMVLARFVSVCVFELPIINRVMNGADPEQSVNERLADGSQDKGTVWGYLTGMVAFVLAV